jgi:hypothetical protein
MKQVIHSIALAAALLWPIAAYAQSNEPTTNESLASVICLEGQQPVATASMSEAQYAEAALYGCRGQCSHLSGQAWMGCFLRCLVNGTRTITRPITAYN